MTITESQAREFLAAINQTSSQTIKSTAAAYTWPILVLWGVILTLAYLGTHFYLKLAWHIWVVLDTLGFIGTAVICIVQFRRAKATRYSNTGKVARRIIYFWAAVIAYMFIWLYLIKFPNGLILNAFLVSVFMFAYIVMGIYENSRFLIWLGIAVTALTLAGVYIIPHRFYCLWMALAFGGTLLITGIYLGYQARSLCRISTK